MVVASAFVAVACASPPEAEQALAALRGLGVPLEDAAVVARTDAGRVELHQTRELAPGEGIVGGGSIGFVAGVLVGLPIGGALAGMLGGGVWGARDTGLDDDRMRELGAHLERGRAVLCTLVAEGDTARVREALAGYGELVDGSDSPPEPPAGP